MEMLKQPGAIPSIMGALIVLLWIIWNLRKAKQEDPELQWLNYRIGVKWPDLIRKLYFGELNIQEMQDCMDDARRWKSCACGKLDPRLSTGTRFFGGPDDDILHNEGKKFMDLWIEVKDQAIDGDIRPDQMDVLMKTYAEELMKCCMIIDAREAELIVQMDAHGDQ